MKNTFIIKGCAFLLVLILLGNLLPIQASEITQTDLAMSVGADEGERNLVW